jgi:hypothetical protein
MTYYMTPAVEADAYTFAEKLREEDKAEIKAASGWLPVDALLVGIKESKKVFSIWTNDHEPICIFGVTNHSLDVTTGVPWMLGTTLIQDYFVAFLRDGRGSLLPIIKDGYELLLNCVDSRNTVHIRWLKWMGFSFDFENPVFLTDPDVPFYLFTYNTKEQHSV